MAWSMWRGLMRHKQCGMHSRAPHRALVFSLLVGVYPASAKGLVFGIAGKRIDDVNFVDTWMGCVEEAKKNGDQCLNIGRPGQALAHQQDLAILDALKQPLAGLAISVTDSDFLAASSLARVTEKHVPLITFDSDLDDKHLHLRHSYVGPDNIEFGRRLGRLALTKRPNGGVLCIMSSSPIHVNLIERQTGIRQVLSGNPAWVVNTRLQGQGGWTEHARCPWNNGDAVDRALKQIKISLTEMKVDTLISVGAWPVFDPNLYRQTIESLKAQDQNIGSRVVVGIGLASAGRIQLLKDGLVAGYVSIDFRDLGRFAYRTMKKLADGQKVEPKVITPVSTYQSNLTRRPPVPTVPKSAPGSDALPPQRPA